LNCINNKSKNAYFRLQNYSLNIDADFDRQAALVQDLNNEECSIIRTTLILCVYLRLSIFCFFMPSCISNY